MSSYNEVAKALDGLGIVFEVVEHEPALTTEQADSFIEGIEGVRTKTMFLTNKNKTAFYLVVMDDAKRLDIEALKALTGENRIKMASADSLMEKMRLPPGTVSVFGLLNNAERDIQVYFDEEIMSQRRMSFHPNVNTKTVFLDTADVLRFVESAGFAYRIVRL